MRLGTCMVVCRASTAPSWQGRRVLAPRRDHVHHLGSQLAHQRRARRTLSTLPHASFMLVAVAGTVPIGQDLAQVLRSLDQFVALTELLMGLRMEHLTVVLMAAVMVHLMELMEFRTILEDRCMKSVRRSMMEGLTAISLVSGDVQTSTMVIESRGDLSGYSDEARKRSKAWSETFAGSYDNLGSSRDIHGTSFYLHLK